MFEINYTKIAPNYKTIALQREENLFFESQLNNFLILLLNSTFPQKYVHVHTKLAILNPSIHPFIHPKAIITSNF